MISESFLPHIHTLCGWYFSHNCFGNYFSKFGTENFYFSVRKLLENAAPITKGISYNTKNVQSTREWGCKTTKVTEFQRITSPSEERKDISTLSHGKEWEES